MFVMEESEGPRLYKSRNKSFLFGGSIRDNNTQKTRKRVFGTTSTLGKFGVRGRPENGGIITLQLQFLFG
jgi:hypothetical protein